MTWDSPSRSVCSNLFWRSTKTMYKLKLSVTDADSFKKFNQILTKLLLMFHLHLLNTYIVFTSFDMSSLIYTSSR